MKRSGQIWVETVLYTLIGLALIGLVLAFVMPKINESRDRVIIEQSIETLNVFDERMNIILDGGAGNVRNVAFTLKKGELYFDSDKDEIRLILSDIEKPFTEPGVDVDIGRIKVLTEDKQKAHSVILKLDYANIDSDGKLSGIADIRYMEGDAIVGLKKFNPASVPYKFSLDNKGDEDPIDRVVEIDIREISN